MAATEGMERDSGEREPDEREPEAYAEKTAGTSSPAGSKTTVRYDLAMHSLYAGRAYGCSGPGYEDIVWLEDGPAPSAELLERRWEEIRAGVLREEVARARELNYPTIDQLTVALWEMLVEGRPAAAERLQLIRERVKRDLPFPAVEDRTGREPDVAEESVPEMRRPERQT